MKMFVDKVARPEFFSKHAGKRSSAVMLRLVLQVISAGTAFVGASEALPVDNPWLRYGLSLFIAASLEFAVLLFGYASLLPWAERLGDVKAYQIEEKAHRIDGYINTISKFLFYGPLACSALLTLLGAFTLGRQVKDPGPRPDFEVIRDSVALVVAAKPIYAADPRRGELARLTESMAAKEAFIAGQDSLHTHSWRNWEEGRISKWPSAAFVWKSQGGREQEMAGLADMRARRSTLSDALSGMNSKLDSEITSEADRIYQDALSAWKTKEKGSNWNGALVLVFGFVAQAGVFALFFFIVMVDIGAGQIRRRVPMLLDNVNIIEEWITVLYQRWKARAVHRIARLSRKPVAIRERQESLKKGYRTFDPADVFNFQIAYLMGEGIARPRPESWRLPLQFYLKQDGDASEQVLAASEPAPDSAKKQPEKDQEIPPANTVQKDLKQTGSKPVTNRVSDDRGRGENTWFDFDFGGHANTSGEQVLADSENRLRTGAQTDGEIEVANTSKNRVNVTVVDGEPTIFHIDEQTGENKEYDRRAVERFISIYGTRVAETTDLLKEAKRSGQVEKVTRLQETLKNRRDKLAYWQANLKALDNLKK